MEKGMTDIQDKLLTVTVPAYNAEQWLSQNLDQYPYEAAGGRLEVLVIDDGSRDGTGALAERYAARFPDTVRVIRKENGGHGSGINTGIREARGKYFKVVDSDDWVDPEAFEKLLGVLSRADDDIVSSGFLWAYDDGSGDPASFRTEAEFTEPFRGVEYDRTYRFSEIADRLYIKMHNVTFKTEVLREHFIPLDEHCFYVDTEYILYPIPFCGTIRFLKEYVYRYRIGREGQSMDPAKMQLYADNYDRVLRSLIRFEKSGDVQGAEPGVRRYIDNLIARVAAARIRVFLSLPCSAENRAALVTFEKRLRKYAPEIYNANTNRAVSLLRRSGYTLYRPACALVRRKYG